MVTVKIKRVAGKPLRTSPSSGQALSWMLIPPPSALNYIWVKGDLWIQVITSTRDSITSYLPLKLGAALKQKDKRLLPHPRAATNWRCLGGGGRPAAGRPEDPGRGLLGVLGGPSVWRGRLRLWRRDPSLRPRPRDLLACRHPQLRSRLPGPGTTARHSARAHAWPSPGRCERSR